MDTSALADRLFQQISGTLEVYAIYLGERLGYYRALADGGPMTSTQLSERTGTHERYTREWLEHQASAGLIEVDGERRFTLPAEHIPVLVDQDSVLFSTFHCVNVARAARGLPNVVEAYRTGDAPPPLPWGPEGRQPANGVLFRNLLGKEWLPGIPQVHERLSTRNARVADIACGLGWSSIAMAQAYPRITVDGLDFDEKAIDEATRVATEAGVGDRVKFSAMDAADLAETEPYDLVTIFEALHDMKRPVEVLQTVRGLLAANGQVLIADTRSEEEFTAPGPDLERYAYGWSLVSCLPAVMGDPESAMTGTVMRPNTLRKYATEAGFSDVQVLPIEAHKWRFYLLSV